MGHVKRDSITCQLLQAVELLHQEGFAHMDIKPDNICYKVETNQLKLLDFEDAVHKSCPKFTYCGSMPYAAPRMVRKQIKHEMEFGLSCDCWSLMVTCLSLVSGAMPFPDSCLRSNLLCECAPLYSMFDSWVEYLRDQLQQHLSSATPLPTVSKLVSVYEDMTSGDCTCKRKKSD